MNRARPVPPFAREIFSYDPSNGHIFRIAGHDGRPLPRPVPVTRVRMGYLSARIGRHEHLAHRLAWFLATGSNPVGQIDHINGDRRDNRLANLREATAAENGCNRAKFKKNGMPKGVRRGYGGRFTAAIGKNRKLFHLGTFSTISAASEAYRRAAAVLHGEFARFE